MASYTHTLRPLAVVGGHGIAVKALPKTISSSTDIPAGSPMVLASSPTEPFRVLAEAALDASDFVTDANDLVGITVSRFLGEYYNNASAHNVLTQDWLIVNALLPGTVIEGNLYYDGNGGSEEVVAGTELFSKVVLKKLSSGVYVFDKETTPSSMATFTVVGLSCQPDTLYGRIQVVPDAAYIEIGG